MNKKAKVLIFDYYPLKINDGGPSGFIAQNIKFENSHNKELYITLSEVLASYKPKSILGKLIFKIKSLYCRILIKDKTNFEAFIFLKYSLYNYKYLFFHDVFTMFKVLPYIKNAQKVILQSHCPELPSSELYNLGMDTNKVKTAQEKERKSFKRADYLVFPNFGCQIIYKEILSSNSTISYILSGSRDFSLDFSPIYLDQNYINLVYIGRQNDIKGFDLVINSFENVSYFRKDLRLYIIGNSKVKFTNPNIVALGFSDRPQAWFLSVDYLINMNRKSYFDLSIIEALSCGLKIIMTKTEGHSYYKDLSPDILEVEASTDSLTLQLKNIPIKIHNTTSSKINKEIFYKHLSSVHYIKRLEDFLANLD